MWKKETKDERDYRVYILGELNFIEQLNELFYTKILRPTRCFVEAVDRIVGWFPIIWRDHDWDADNSLARIIIYKLKRVAPVLENGHTVSGPKDAKRMREVVEHLKRYLNIERYTQQGDLEWEFEESGNPGFKRLNIKMTKYDKYLFDRAEKLEQWHWQEAWRKISKYGRGWWD